VRRRVGLVGSEAPFRLTILRFPVDELEAADRVGRGKLEGLRDLPRKLCEFEMSKRRVRRVRREAT